MSDEHYPHIFLPNEPDLLGFTNPQSGGGKPRIPQRDRHQHSQYIRNQLNAAWNSVDQQQAVIHSERVGAYLEFAGDPGSDLIIKSLEDRRSGIRLLNVRQEIENENVKTYATIYIPLSKRGHFLRKVNRYAEEETIKGTPKHQTLINSISEIRNAVLESFWQDERSLIPGDDSHWIEIWLSSDQNGVVERFNALLEHLDISKAEGRITFPERTVQLINANREQLQSLIESSDDIAELRRAKKVATFFIEMENAEQLEQARKLLSRTTFSENNRTAICILDTGINNGHILIQPVLADDNRYSVDPVWGVNDDDGHGTLMAGLATYGDLLSILHSEHPIQISHFLESAKILPPGSAQNDSKLWGYITQQGISLAEINGADRLRIICLAVTSIDSRDRGRPSSWSGELDKVISGAEDDQKRLIILSAGNIYDGDEWRNYPDSNMTNEVHDPGQSWNALTVGAYTEKITITDPTLADYNAVAPPGGISPFSTTSLSWENKWPIKPEVMFEGGNVARSPNDSIIDIDDLSLLSTSHEPTKAQFSQFGMTSAASALAANMAAQIQTKYPDAWPETIRGLIVHSANWTDKMKDQFLPDQSKLSYRNLLRICGYGVADLDHALFCASNSLTLISQRELQPFDKKADGDGYITKDMHFYDLPWPTEALTGLHDTEVQMRVTLSYFIEPGPGEVGWKDRYRYPSHALRFTVKGPTESRDEFIRRINAQARSDDDKKPDTSGPGDRWIIGSTARNVGSIHSDIWRGTAADLAASNLIAIYPAVGWWRERHHLTKWNKHCRYSLIVSINTPPENIDIYNEVAVQIGIEIPIST